MSKLNRVSFSEPIDDKGTATYWFNVAGPNEADAGRIREDASFLPKEPRAHVEVLKPSPYLRRILDPAVREHVIGRLGELRPVALKLLGE